LSSTPIVNEQEVARFGGEPLRILSSKGLALNSSDLGIILEVELIWLGCPEGNELPAGYDVTKPSDFPKLRAP
jgi:hypothetical protein